MSVYKSNAQHLWWLCPSKFIVIHKYYVGYHTEC